jgi:hypothetical protein
MISEMLWLAAARVFAQAQALNATRIGVKPPQPAKDRKKMSRIDFPIRSGAAVG